MTEYHPPRRSFALVIVALIALAVLASACTGVATPEGWASPILVLGDDPEQEDLLLVAHRDLLIALDADGLSPQWAFPPDEDDEDIDVRALYGTPATLGELVFMPAWDEDGNGTLYALKRETGELDWSRETDGPLIGGVTVFQDTVYFGSSDGNVYALDAESGDLRWPPFETGKEIWSAPTLAGDTLFVTSLDGKLYALDPENGNLRWAFKTDAGIASPPVVDEEAGLVYVGGFDSQMRAIDLETHEERWSVQADNWFWARPLIAEGVLYAGSLDGNVYAVDVESGDLLWAQPFETDAPVRAAPLIAGGVLIVIDRDGKVYGIDPDSGFSAFGSPLLLDADVLADPLVQRIESSDGEAVVDEEVLVVTTKGEVVRIDPTTLRTIEQRTLRRQ